MRTPGKRRGGRKAGTPNKATIEIKAAARLHGEAMIGELARIALNADSDQARVAAIKELLDRGYGKAAQPVTGEDGEGPVQVRAVVRFVRPDDQAAAALR